MVPHELQVQCQNRAEPRRGKRRAANATAKAPLLIRLQKDPDGGPKNAGSSGAATRHALGYVLPHNLRVRPWQRRACLRVKAQRESQPLMQMLAYHLARVLQSQQTACDSVDTPFVC